ncbi:winged helix-turn-helix domain-containing protein [Nostoc sp.]
MLWVLNLSDGHHTLLDIAERWGMSFDVTKYTVNTLLLHDLVTCLTKSS